MIKNIATICLMLSASSVIAQEVNYPENLHGGVYIRSYYVPSTCEMNACNAVNIDMVKEFFDHLNDSNRTYINFDLYPAKLQRIAREEHSALSYCMFDMTTVVKNNINQVKLAQVVNSLSNMIKEYYKTHDAEKNLNIKIQFAVKASNKKTEIELHSIYMQEEKDNDVRYVLPKDLSEKLNQFLEKQHNPIITKSKEEIIIKFENSYITNNYDYLKKPQ